MQRFRRRIAAGARKSTDESSGGIAPPIRIGTAELDDLDALCSVEKECFAAEAFSKELVASLLQDRSAVSLLAKVTDEAIGFIIAQTYTKKGCRIVHVLTVDVAPKARRMGVGRRLLEELERRAREKGVVASCLEVDATNSAARKLYRSLGYAETGFVRGYYRSGGDCITMVKTLL